MNPITRQLNRFVNTYLSDNHNRQVRARNKELLKKIGAEKAAIFVADDFGRDDGLNSTVKEAYEKGGISGASTIVGASGLEDAIEYAKANPELDVGSHLVYSRSSFNYEPIRPQTDVPALKDKDGYFIKGDVVLPWKLLKNTMGLAETGGDALYHEFEEQFNRLKDAGVDPAFIAPHMTHFYTHIAPEELTKAIVKLAKNEKLPLRTQALRLNHDVANAGVAIPNRLVAISDEETLVDDLQRSPHGTITEYVAHGFNPEKPEKGRKEGLDACRSDNVRQAIEDQGISVISYGDLKELHNSPNKLYKGLSNAELK
ncbi:MAG: ChbG/HpnK family deacetylase [bacterium]|nr:ChbG/HpnK family deacetylase [bacterium]